MTQPALKRTALYELHAELGAKLVEFGGWEMPLSYADGTVTEHRACREDAVVFDVSHLGTVAVKGPGSTERLQSTLTNDLNKVAPGRAQYTHLLDEHASVVDDIIVWWRGEDAFDVMPNASNTDRVVEAVGGSDTTATRAVIAVQGPAARAKISLLSPDASSVGRFHVIETTIGSVPVVVAGTGYTGEDGIEIAVPAEAASELFRRIVDAGVRPAGLGARDTLRLEAGLPLHGHELGEGITPLDAGLGWVVGWNKPEFRGREALLAQRAAGPTRRLMGIVGSGRQPLRDGATVRFGEVEIGATSSGNFSPMLGVGIALAFIDAAADVAIDDPVTVEVRGRSIDARLSDYPFWPPRS